MNDVSPLRYCACHCKDTHFEAIHNDVYDSVFDVTIVLAAAKIYILKQFTTEQFHYHGAVGLYGSVEAQMVNGKSAAFFFYPFAMSGIFRTFARISE